MSDNNSTLVPADNGEATPPPSKKPSLRARIKAHRQKFEAEHPLRSACCEEAMKGATYAAAAFGTLIALGALMSLGSNTDDGTDDTIESDAEDILDDEEE
jgi:hypothetical protein